MPNNQYTRTGEVVYPVIAEETVKTRRAPHKNPHGMLSPVVATAIQSAVVGVLGLITGVVLVVAVDHTAAMLVGLPLMFSFTLPWLRLTMMAGEQRSVWHEDHVLSMKLELQRKEIALEELRQPVLMPAPTHSEVLQDLDAFVAAVFGATRRPSSKTYWTEGEGAGHLSRPYTYDDWKKNLIQPGLDAGLFDVTISTDGRTMPRPKKHINYTQAKDLLKEAGYKL